MAKVLLIQAAHHYAHHTHLQPLGVMSVAATLRRAGHDVRIFDMKVERVGLKEVVEQVAAFRPRVVGISCMTYESLSAMRIADQLKKSFPEITLIAGGPHPTNSTEEVLRGGAVEYVCIGEGDHTAVELVDAIEGGGDFGAIRGVAYLEDGEVVRTPERENIMDLDALPMPAWDLLPVAKYFDLQRGGIIYKHKQFMTVMSSRSCPWKCTYCHNNLGKTYRAFSPTRVVDEMQAVHDRFGVREYIFMDDMFNLYPDRVKEICRQIKERRLEIAMTFPNGLRADIMDMSTVEAMRDAGMYRCMYAVETASPRIQKQIKKYVNLDKTFDVINKTSDMGVLTHGAFMLGFPTETEEEARATIEYAVKTRLDTAAFFRVLPFRGSELYDEVASRGYDEDIRKSYEYYNSRVNLSAIPDETVVRLRQKAYRDFYLLSPRRMARLLRKLPNKAELLPVLGKMFLSRAFEGAGGYSG